MPAIPRLYAYDFRHKLTGGRTNPCVLACEHEDGSPAGEYVVKLTSNLDAGAMGQVAELAASKLASHLEMAVASPAIIYVDEALASAIPDPTIAGCIQRSAGPNFGCEFMTGGFTTWSIGGAIAPKFLTKALDVFVFDLLIENPDRVVTLNKPNLLVRGDQFIMIDHELAFSFVFDILPDPKPWELSRLEFMTKHIFYDGLCKLMLNYDGIHSRLRTVTEDTWLDINNDTPNEWRTAHLDKMKDCVLSKVSNVDTFLARIQEKLR